MHNLPEVMRKHDQQDFLMQSTREWITKNQFTDISISKIQRYFRIGYNRAAKILYMLEKENEAKNKIMRGESK